MAALGGLFFLLGLASLVAVIKPFGPYKKRWHALIGFLVLITIGGALAPSPSPSSTTTSTQSTPQSTAAPTEVAVNPSTPETPSSQWRYSRQRDEMRNATTSIACLDSTNELDFDFPYQGGSVATICFRQSPQYGFDAWIRIERGQFTCFLDCRIHARFGDGAVQTFSAGGASDGSADIIFVTNATRFLNATKGADRIVVEAEFYQAGARQMVFENASGLEWPMT